MARNECRRRLRARALPGPPGAANEVTDDTVDLDADAESAELRAIVGAALAGLDPGDREAIALNSAAFNLARITGSLTGAELDLGD